MAPDGTWPWRETVPGPEMIDRYLRDVLDGENRVSRRCKSERLAPVMSDLRSRRSRMAGSVNIGNIGATEDAARRRFAAVATHAPSHDQPHAAARLARDIDQSSRYPSGVC